MTEEVELADSHILNEESWLSSSANILSLILILILSTGEASDEASRDNKTHYVIKSMFTEDLMKEYFYGVLDFLYLHIFCFC